MKTTIFSVAFALIGINAAVAADHTNVSTIPSPTTLVETTLLPQFKAKVKMEAKGWYSKCGSADKPGSEVCFKENKSFDKPAGYLETSSNPKSLDRYMVRE